VVMTGGGRFIEVQGTAEKTPFADKEMLEMLKLAKQGVRQLIEMQRKQVGKVMAHGTHPGHA
jgi:ribonuclease PH